MPCSTSIQEQDDIKLAKRSTEADKQYYTSSVVHYYYNLQAFKEQQLASSKHNIQQLNARSNLNKPDQEVEERLLVQGLGRVTCHQEKRLLPPGVGVVVAGRIQASPAAAVVNPGGGGFVPGGGGFDPEETGTWESLVVVWRAACDSCKNRVSFWAMAVFGLGRIPSLSRTCPAVSLGFF